MALIKKTGNTATAIYWRANAEDSWKAYRLTDQQYEALKVKGAGAPPAPPEFRGTKEEWDAVWFSNGTLSRGRRGPEYDTPTGLPSPGDVILRAVTVREDFTEQVLDDEAALQIAKDEG